MAIVAIITEAIRKTLQTKARTTGIQTGFVRSHYYADDHIGRADNAAQGRAAVAQTKGQIRQITSEERARTVSQAGEIFKDVKAEAQRIRLEMTNRYQMEF